MPLLETEIRRKDIESFLRNLKTVLESENFNIGIDFFLNIKKDSTLQTISDLNYDIADVVNELKGLTIYDFSQAVIDIDYLNPPILYIFGKEINHKLVYIKLKIKEISNNKHQVICVSFHFAKNKMAFPYKKNK